MDDRQLSKDPSSESQSLFNGKDLSGWEIYGTENGMWTMGFLYVKVAPIKDMDI